MTIIVDYDKAIELLTAAVERKGEDFVYNPGGSGSCSYVAKPNRLNGVYDGPELDENGKSNPGCIVGHVLYSLGVDLYRVGSGSMRSIMRHRYGPHAALNSDLTMTFSEDAVEALQRAQSSQDDGSTWGRALEAAKSTGSGNWK
jgi:hypothetical protein